MLTESQIEALHHDGYIHIKNVVETHILLEGQKKFNRWRHELISGDRKLGRDDKVGICQFCHAFQNKPFMHTLRETANAYAKFLLGQNNVYEYGSVMMGWPPAYNENDTRQAWHVDGVDKVLDSEDQAQFPQFQLVIGFPLIHITDEKSGGLVVWPGQHQYIANIFNENDDIKSSLEKIQKNMYSSFPPGERRHLYEKAGDILLFNGLLPHGTAVNHSPYFADKIYFRFCHAKPEMRIGIYPCRNPWANWAIQ